MTRRTPIFAYVFLILTLAVSANAQTAGTIAAGTQIVVRTNEAINADDADGRVFSGIVERDVKARNGSVLIPRNSDVDLVVNEVSDSELAVDLQAITINGQRYTVAGQSLVTGEREDGLGANKRTATHVGGGALAGAIIGAIAGGGKGAAIGAGAGAATGAAVQVLTRGDSVRVPAESLLTFQLQQPIRAGATTSSLGTQNPSTNSAAYRDGLSNGEADAERSLDYNDRTSRWTRARDRRDYEAGYERGYNAELAAVDPYYDTSASVVIGRDNNISWNAPFNTRIYVKVDNNPRQLFAEGQSGVQPAPWIERGHFYLFVLEDMNGREIARDTLDTRNRRR